MSRKSCFNCIHGNKALNSEIWQDDARLYRISCVRVKEIDEMGKKYSWNEYKLPDACGLYEPKLIKCCAYCNAVINAAEYSWDKWAGVGVKPVCSSDCRIKLEAGEIGYFFSD